jgi:hypothetical protein
MKDFKPLGGKRAIGQISSVDAAEIERLKQFRKDLDAATMGKEVREAYVKMYPKLRKAVDDWEKENL